MTSKLLIAFSIIAVLTSLFIKNQHIKETGGYEYGTDSYFGYRFPIDNGFTKADDCNRAITDFQDESPVSQQWLDGCIRYFDIND